jgi:hypothetical protein
MFFNLLVVFLLLLISLCTSQSDGGGGIIGGSSSSSNDSGILCDDSCKQGWMIAGFSVLVFLVLFGISYGLRCLYHYCKLNYCVENIVHTINNNDTNNETKNTENKSNNVEPRFEIIYEGHGQIFKFKRNAVNNEVEGSVICEGVGEALFFGMMNETFIDINSHTKVSGNILVPCHYSGKKTMNEWSGQWSGMINNRLQCGTFSVVKKANQKSPPSPSEYPLSLPTPPPPTTTIGIPISQSII